ncbi:hypothetical protein D3H55_17915 [Bacillus salacetis]|uniref:Uncharacterized protein n=1 Tax=Bacillus salacetis TaxID=2315464 RepID=A0A3A1QS70_9BACI|nr:hypothetical protein D3H55_17915 [Bacillus salacetis]
MPHIMDRLYEGKNPPCRSIFLFNQKKTEAKRVDYEFSFLIKASMRVNYAKKSGVLTHAKQGIC